MGVERLGLLVEHGLVVVGGGDRHHVLLVQSLAGSDDGAARRRGGARAAQIARILDEESLLARSLIRIRHVSSSVVDIRSKPNNQNAPSPLRLYHREASRVAAGNPSGSTGLARPGEIRDTHPRCS